MLSECGKRKKTKPVTKSGRKYSIYSLFAHTNYVFFGCLRTQQFDINQE